MAGATPSQPIGWTGTFARACVFGLGLGASYIGLGVAGEYPVATVHHCSPTLLSKLLSEGAVKGGDTL
jgi:hypothetical protein